MLLQDPTVKRLVDMYKQQKQLQENGQPPQAVIPDQSIPEAHPLE